MSGNLRISWSSLKKFEACSQLYKASRDRQTKEVINGRVFLPGTIADRIMRAWLESESPEPGQMLDMVDEYFRRYTEPEGDEERKEAQYVIKWKGDKRKDQEKVKSFVREVLTGLEPILVKEVLPHDYHPELKFRATIYIPGLDGTPRPIDMIGGIDVAVRLRDENGPTDRYKLFDLKATQNADYIRTTLGQGIFYDIAFGHWIGDRKQPERFGFIAPPLPEKIYWADIEDEHRLQMLSRIVKMAHGVWRGEFAPKESDVGCGYCEANHVCPKMMVVSQKDAQGRNRASFGDVASRRRTAEQAEKLAANKAV